MIGFVRASFVGLMKAYHATGDSTNFPVPCKMAHEPTDYRTLYRPFLYYYDWREAARHLSSYARKSRTTPGTGHSLEYSNAGSSLSPSFDPPGNIILLSANFRLS